MGEHDKVKVTERALIQRINRKLATDGQQLKTPRSERVRLDLGDYFIVNIERNFVDAMHVELEKLGRELGVLREWEALTEE